MGVERQMEQGDWCSLRWVDSESVLAVPGLLRFHSAAPGHGERPAGAERGKGGNLTQVSRWLYGNTRDCLFVRQSCESSRLSWKIFIVVAALQVCLHFDDMKINTVYAGLSDKMNYSKYIIVDNSLVQRFLTKLRLLANLLSLVAVVYQLWPFKPLQRVILQSPEDLKWSSSGE